MARPAKNTFSTLDEALAIEAPEAAAFVEVPHATEPKLYARTYKADKQGRVKRVWATRYHEIGPDGKKTERRPPLGNIVEQDGEKAIDMVEAQMRCRKLLAEVDAAKREGRAVVPTLAAAFERFIEHKTKHVASDKRLRPATVIDYQDRMNQLVPDTMMAKRLNELTWVEWSSWKGWVTSQPRFKNEGADWISTKPANGKAKSMKPVGEARAMGLLKGPISGIYKFWSGQIPGLVTPLKELRHQGVVSNVRRSRREYIQFADMPKAWNVIKTQLTQDARDCVLIALMTGWRDSLVLRIRLDRIDQEKRTVRWLPTDPGGPYKEAFDYPVSDWLWQHVFVPRLELVTPKQVYLIPTRSRKKSSKGHYTDFRVQASKLRDVLGYRCGPQDYRRTFQTVATAAGVHPYQCSHLMMHETLKADDASGGSLVSGLSQMQLDYTKKDLTLMRESANKVTAKYLELAGVAATSAPAPVEKPAEAPAPALDLTNLSAEDRDMLFTLLKKMGAKESA